MQWVKLSQKREVKNSQKNYHENGTCKGKNKM